MESNKKEKEKKAEQWKDQVQKESQTMEIPKRKLSSGKTNSSRKLIN